MIRRATEEDISFVNLVLGDDSIYPHNIDDFNDDSLRWRHGEILINNPAMWVIIANVYTVVVFSPINSVMFDIHTSILPDGRGSFGACAVKEAIEWIFNNTQAVKVIGFIPSFNHRALKYAKLCGFQQEGVVKKSYQKNGILYDQVVIGTGKEKPKCQ